MQKMLERNKMKEEWKKERIKNKRKKRMDIRTKHNKKNERGTKWRKKKSGKKKSPTVSKGRIRLNG
jgi:hypothetical protein